MEYKEKCPVWMTVLIIVLCLPLFSFPALLSMLPQGCETLGILYPFYVIGTGVCAWICYPSRKTVTWILLSLMVLSHLGIWWLAFYGQPIG